MTKDNYQKLLTKGNKILERYMPELNKISNEHIKNQNYRREEDVNEIAIALALYDYHIESLLV